MNLKKCYEFSVNIEISLVFKVYFSLVTCKINNLIALRSTSQIIEISAPWLIRKMLMHRFRETFKNVKFGSENAQFI